MSPVDHIMPISNTNYMDGMAKKKIPDVTERTFNRSIFYIIYASISIEVSSQRLNLSHNLSWLDNKKKICSQVIKIIRVSFNFRCIRVLKYNTWI